MNMNTRIKTEEICATTHTSLCWKAILAGTLVGLGLAFLLNLFAVAIGLSAYSASPTSTNGMTAIAIGGVLALLVGTIVSMGLAGYVSGYLGGYRYYHTHSGVLYGFVTWSLALILSALLVIPMSKYLHFYENNLNRSVTATVASPSMDENVDNSKQRKEMASTSTVTVEPKHLAYSGWLLFVLFFVGALSSCIGACYGMQCCRETISTLPPRNPPL